MTNKLNNKSQIISSELTVKYDGYYNVSSSYPTSVEDVWIDLEGICLK
jgi:hypothetical protein